MPKQTKLSVKFGTFSKYFILAIYSVFFLYLLCVVGMQEKDPQTVESLFYGILMAVIGISIGTVLVGFDNTEVVSGREDLIKGVVISVAALAIMFILNYAFLLGKNSYSLIGNVASLTKGERFIASLTAATNEEFFFRFAVQRMLQAPFPDNPVGWTPPVFISAAMFSVYHVYTYGGQGIEIFVYLFLLGCAAGFGLAASKRFSVPLLIHVNNNALAVILGG